ncbi:MAG: two-component system response regulator, partial [bacterium]|nr:two-component system response regulator [bacterium]
GIKGDDIHLYARIIAIADVFDALTSKRPYKDSWPVEKAVNLIKEESGKHFDPALVRAFLETIDEAVAIKGQFSD